MMCETAGFDIFEAVLLKPFVVPIFVYFGIKDPAKPNIEPHELETFPDDTKNYFLKNIKALEENGFNIICCCVYTGQSPLDVSHLCLLKHTNKQDLAMIVAGYNNTGYIEFWSKFQLIDISTNNINSFHHPLVFPERQDEKKYYFPDIYNHSKLYAVHRLLINRDANGAVPNTIPDGDELAEIEKWMIRKKKRNVENGYYRFDASSDAYRPTIRGAVLMTWKTIWPFKDILFTRRTRKMEAVLLEVTRDNFHFAAQSTDNLIHNEANIAELSHYPVLTEKYPFVESGQGITAIYNEEKIRWAVNTSFFYICLIVFFIFPFGLIAISPVTITFIHFFQLKRLDCFGSQAQALVIKKEIYKEKRSSGDSETSNVEYYFVQHRYVLYQFQLLINNKTKKGFSKKEEVSEEMYNQIKVGTWVPVVYDQNNPSDSLINGGYMTLLSPDMEVIALFSFGGILTIFVSLAIAGLAVIKLLGDVVPFVALRIKGQMTTAVIVELKKHDLHDAFDGESTGYAMIYQFQPSGKNTVITGRQLISKIAYTIYHQRKTVDVLYFPRKPEWFKAIVN